MFINLLCKDMYSYINNAQYDEFENVSSTLYKLALKNTSTFQGKKISINNMILLQNKSHQKLLTTTSDITDTGSSGMLNILIITIIYLGTKEGLMNSGDRKDLLFYPRDQKSSVEN